MTEQNQLTCTFDDPTDVKERLFNFTFISQYWPKIIIGIGAIIVLWLLILPIVYMEENIKCDPNDSNSLTEFRKCLDEKEMNQAVYGTPVIILGGTFLSIISLVCACTDYRTFGKVNYLPE